MFLLKWLLAGIAMGESALPYVLGHVEERTIGAAGEVGFLSALGRMVTKTKVRDFHCGLRGLTRDAARRLPFRTGGMEFASEMIVLAAREGLRIGQTPVPLRRCPQEKRRSKLRTLPDGFRHLKYLLRVARR